jgi:hypothetical protein
MVSMHCLYARCTYIDLEGATGSGGITTPCELAVTDVTIYNRSATGVATCE